MNINTSMVLPRKTLAPLFSVSGRAAGFVLFLTALLFSSASHSEDYSDAQYSTQSPGMINRAPLVSSKIELGNLDRISTDIGNITESLHNILTSPIEEETTTEAEETEETEEEPVKAQPLIAEPEKEIPKKIKIAQPNTQPTKPLAVINKQVEPEPAAPLEIITNAAKEAEIITAKTDDLPVIKQNKYLKIDLNGKTLADDSDVWSCVEDTNNGLVWEVKSSNGGMHDKNNLYSWLQPSSTGAPQGVADAGKCKGDISCDTQSYAQAVNAQSYCGYSDWRLPTREEMLSIVNFEQTSSTVKINNDYFPETLPSWYWTASSNENHPDHAWYVLFRNGIAINDLKARPKHIRLVRNQTQKG